MRFSFLYYDSYSPVIPSVIQCIFIFLACLFLAFANESIVIHVVIFRFFDALYLMRLLLPSSSSTNSNNCMISHFHDMRSLCVCVYMYVVLLDTIYVYLQALLANNTDISSSPCVYALLFIYEIYSIIINHARRLCKQ